MRFEMITESVLSLEERGVLKVEDGNHGEYRPRKNEFVDQGVSFIRAADIKDGIVMFDHSERINETALSRIRKGIGRPGDVLITHKGTIGRVGLVADDAPDFVCSPQTTFWRVIDQSFVDRYYLYAYMRSPQFQELFCIYGGETDMAPYVSLTSQRSLVLSLPDIAAQREIGKIIQCLDSKIHLNRKTNETLEGIAKALFKSWFVDFDPVRAKAEGRPTGLPDEVSELFPDSFEESELGEIPSGWSQSSLDKIAKYLNGLALQKFPPKGDNTDLPVIKIAQLRRGDANDSDKCSNDLEEEYVIEDGDILFSWSGSLLVDTWTGGKGALNQHLFKVTSEQFQKWFIYLWTHNHLEEFQAIAQSKATTMGHIQRKHLSEAKVLIPPRQCLAYMNEIFEPFLQRQIQGRLESKTLSSLRDALLPKLISGELRIPDAEKMLEEVGI
jgi:type I restriction enzyme S subunit